MKFHLVAIGFVFLVISCEETNILAKKEFLPVEVIELDNNHITAKIDGYLQWLDFDFSAQRFLYTDYSKCPKLEEKLWLSGPREKRQKKEQEILHNKGRYYSNLTVLENGIEIHNDGQNYALIHGNDFYDFLPFLSGKRVFTWGLDGRILLWKVAEDVEVIWEIMPADMIGEIIVSKDETKIVSLHGRKAGSKSLNRNEVSVWNLEKKEEPIFKIVHQEPPIGVQLVEEEGHIVSWDIYGEVKFSDLNSGAPLEDAIELQAGIHHAPEMSSLSTLLYFKHDYPKGQFTLLNSSRNDSTIDLKEIANSIEHITDFKGKVCG